MSIITWRNVGGVDAGASASLLKAAGESISGGIGQVGNALEDHRVRRTEENTQNFLDQVAQLRTVDEATAARQDGRFDRLAAESGHLIDRSKARGAVDSRVESLRSAYTKGQAYETQVLKDKIAPEFERAKIASLNNDDAGVAANLDTNSEAYAKLGMGSQLTKFHQEQEESRQVKERSLYDQNLADSDRSKADQKTARYEQGTATIERIIAEGKEFGMGISEMRDAVNNQLAPSIALDGELYPYWEKRAAEVFSMGTDDQRDLAYKETEIADTFNKQDIELRGNVAASQELLNSLPKYINPTKRLTPGEGMQALESSLNLSGNEILSRDGNQSDWGTGASALGSNFNKVLAEVSRRLALPAAKGEEGDKESAARRSIDPVAFTVDLFQRPGASYVDAKTGKRRMNFGGVYDSVLDAITELTPQLADYKIAKGQLSDYSTKLLDLPAARTKALQDAEKGIRQTRRNVQSLTSAYK